jgi:hypothetical protein
MSEIFVYTLRVYYQDTDAGGIVYHANYLNFGERARAEALREMGVPHVEMVRQFGVMFVVRRLQIDYQRPARSSGPAAPVQHFVRISGATATRWPCWRSGWVACGLTAERLKCRRFGGRGCRPRCWDELERDLMWIRR